LISIYNSKKYSINDMNIVKKCKKCGKDFKIEKYRENTAHYCSRECYWKDKKKTQDQEKTCIRCG